MKIIDFTFQYGQIYYSNQKSYCWEFNNLYIPIWLDLLFSSIPLTGTGSAKLYIPIWLDLLSPAQAQIMSSGNSFTFQYGQIYYLSVSAGSLGTYKALHSNMVRFIIYFYVK